MKINGKITLLFSHDGMTIDLEDADASTTFVKITLNQEQTCQALSRLAYTSCDMEVKGLEKIGKEMVTDTLIFEFNDENYNYQEAKEKAGEKALDLCKDTDWIPDNYFSSQDSFFTKDEKKYAKTYIRKWINKKI